MKEGETIQIQINISNKSILTLLLIIMVLIGGASALAYTRSLPNPGHGGDSILVSIVGEEKTLQEAINDNSLVPNIAITSGEISGEGGTTTIPTPTYQNGVRATTTDCHFMYSDKGQGFYDEVHTSSGTKFLAYTITQVNNLNYEFKIEGTHMGTAGIRYTILCIS